MASTPEMDQKTEVDSSDKPMLLFVAGDQMNVGKSTLCLSILGCLLDMGYKPSELAYIKPCTQCEAVQLVWKYCQKMGIAHEGIGPVKFKAGEMCIVSVACQHRPNAHDTGFTYDCIKNDTPAIVAARHESIKAAVGAIGKGKRLVLVDGVGYPGVGSTASVSNATVAHLLGAPVLLVGRPGVGNAIDSMSMLLAFFKQEGVQVLGTVFNNIPKAVSYHTFESVQEHVTLYFQKRLPALSLYGCVPRNEVQWKKHLETADERAGICLLKVFEEDLVMSAEEEQFAKDSISHVSKHVDMSLLLKDIQKYYGRQ